MLPPEAELRIKLIEFIGNDPDPVQQMRCELAIAMRRQIATLERAGPTDALRGWCAALRRVLKDLGDVAKHGHPTSLRFMSKMAKRKVALPPQPQFKSKMRKVTTDGS